MWRNHIWPWTNQSAQPSSSMCRLNHQVGFTIGYALLRKYVVSMILSDWSTQMPIVYHSLPFTSLQHNKFADVQWNHFKKCALEDKEIQLFHLRISLSLAVESTRGSCQTNRNGESKFLLIKCLTLPRLCNFWLVNFHKPIGRGIYLATGSVKRRP